MQNDDANTNTIYTVVMNHEEQYSIWPADREPPPGWQRMDKSGTSDECLDYIGDVWTDIRPLSMRKRLEAEEQAAS